MDWKTNSYTFGSSLPVPSSLKLECGEDVRGKMTPMQTLQELGTARVHILGILTHHKNDPATDDLVQWTEALMECLCKEVELRQALQFRSVVEEDNGI